MLNDFVFNVMLCSKDLTDPVFCATLNIMMQISSNLLPLIKQLIDLLIDSSLVQCESSVTSDSSLVQFIISLVWIISH